MKYLVGLMIVLLLIAGCQEGDTDQTGTAQFLGGTTGIVPEFIENSPPSEVYDGGNFPFDVVVRLTNKGEYPVPSSNVKVTLSGILAEEFGTSQANLISSPVDDVLGRNLDSEGNVLESSPVFVEFPSLNHKSTLSASTQRFPLQASVCYLYGTIATSTLCSRQNILNPKGTQICTVNEDKSVSNSGAPVQVASLRESARAIDKVGFTFKITHSGQGDIYDRGSGCDKLDRRFENKVNVRVSSGIPGLACTGLEGGDQGVVTLFGGEKTITCTQQIPTPADFEFPVTIELSYDYEERVTTEIIVKRTDSGSRLPTY